MAFHPTRRGVLAGAAAFTAWASIPKLAAAAGSRDPRFVTVILRGGLDGLAAVAPVGDPGFEAVRDFSVTPADGAAAPTPLDGFFVLDSRLPTLAELYARGEALFVHAVHTPYRQRSHFEAQDVLENGTTSHAHFRDGWLGRALGALPVESRMGRQGSFAAAAAPPLVLRGAGEVVTWLPAGLPAASDDTRLRLLTLYEHTDPVLAQVLSGGLALEDVVGSEAEMTAQLEASMMDLDIRPRSRQAVAAASAAGRSLAADDGPRVGFLDLAGFDTHRGQNGNGALGLTLATLDATLGALRTALGPVWEQTVVTVLTEFGRTVRMNSSDGTDHGSATVAMLLGGAVRGGRVIADWPGLTEGALHEGRDLAPTTDLRAVLKGALRDHLGFDRAGLDRLVFPDSAEVRAMEGLIRA